MGRINVIGIGYRPLNERARELVLGSEAVIASERLFEVFSRYPEFDHVWDRIKVIGTVDYTIDYLKSMKPGSVTLLADGDPMFFGIGGRILKEFGRGDTEVIPDLSSIQVAFSRIGESWDDASLISMHGGPDPEKRRGLACEVKDINRLVLDHYKLGVLTDRENSPSVIATAIVKYLKLFEFYPFHPVLYVCERLGYPGERIVEGSPEKISSLSFLHPSVLIIIRENK